MMPAKSTCPACLGGEIERLERRIYKNMQEPVWCSIRSDGRICCSHIRSDLVRFPSPAPLGITTDPAQRKAAPIASGVLHYFPNALAAVANLSKVGNEQHNPGQPMHWAFDKSTDEADCITRHLAEVGTIDTDGVRHAAKVAWRALALLERELLAAYPELKPGRNVRGFSRLAEVAIDATGQMRYTGKAEVK